MQTHINDVMLRRYSKARSAANSLVNGDISCSSKPQNFEVYEKRLQDLSKAYEESQKKIEKVHILTNFLFILQCKIEYNRGRLIFV